MPLRKFKAMFGALALVALLWVPILPAQSPATLTLTVEDSAGAVVPGATIRQLGGSVLGQSLKDGHLSIQCSVPCRLHIEAAGFAGKDVQVSADMTIHLDPAASSEQITVTAYRAPLGSLESPVTTRLLTQSALVTSAATTLDGQVRQLPGVELFRRSSSLVANPTSQGISMRGLGSTSASRTLVTQDDMPLNDPIGGWIQWEEQPELAIDRIEVLRGGASDLYGSSAIGGVLNLIPARPATNLFELRSNGGSLGTYDNSLLLESHRAPWGVIASGGAIGTDGFIQESPLQRGPIDIASNMHGQDGVIEAERMSGAMRLFVRGNGFNEARANGTPFQTNGTRLWRYLAGDDWQGANNATAALHLYGSTEHYRQTFSSIGNAPTPADPTCVYRCSETPTRFTLVPVNELGAAAHWSQPVGAGLLLLGGADVHDERLWDREQTFGTTAALTNLRDHQRDSAAYIEAMWTHRAWTLTASGRVDWFQNFDAHQLKWNGTTWTPSATQPPSSDETIFDPRMGLSRKIANHWAVSASGFRAFRAPTPSELYRSTQVGNKLTKPNSALLSERATGWETGLATEWKWGTVRASYFLTQVNRPIVAVTLNAQSSPILLLRENLGQIESRGTAIDFELAPQRWLALDGGYQHAQATVTRGSQDLGNWIPEVARNMASMNLRASKPALGTISLQSRLSGHQFDDDANLFLLHGYFRLDAYAAHDFGKRLQIFATSENLFNRSIEVSKTPTTTLATPRTAQMGLQLRLGGEKK